MAAPPIDRLDHLVLTVASVEASVAFYTRVLGLAKTTFDADRNRSILRFPEDQPSSRGLGDPAQGYAADARIGRPLFHHRRAEHVIAHLHACGVEVEEGPVRRTGALGSMTSVYCRDPDGNLVEVANYD